MSNKNYLRLSSFRKLLTILLLAMPAIICIAFASSGVFVYSYCNARHELNQTIPTEDFLQGDAATLENFARHSQRLVEEELPPYATVEIASLQANYLCRQERCILESYHAEVYPRYICSREMADFWIFQPEDTALTVPYVQTHFYFSNNAIETSTFDWWMGGDPPRRYWYSERSATLEEVSLLAHAYLLDQNFFEEGDETITVYISKSEISWNVTIPGTRPLRGFSVN